MSRGLGSAQLRALAVLLQGNEDEPGRWVAVERGYLQGRVSPDPSNARRVVRTLEERGLVERVTPPGGGAYYFPTLAGWIRGVPLDPATAPKGPHPDAEATARRCGLSLNGKTP